jgi:hypothetical protein
MIKLGKIQVVGNTVTSPQVVRGTKIVLLSPESIKEIHQLYRMGWRKAQLPSSTWQKIKDPILMPMTKIRINSMILYTYGYDNTKATLLVSDPHGPITLHQTKRLICVGNEAAQVAIATRDDRRKYGIRTDERKRKEGKNELVL